MRTRLVATVALGLAISLVGTVAAGATPRSAHPTSVPWGSVGRGWVLADWTLNDNLRAAHPTTDLVLVAPDGHRYVLWRERGEHLVGWSGDGQRAVFQEGISTSSYVVRDLRTGAALDRFSFIQSNAFIPETVAFTRPDGFAIDLGSQTDGHQALARYSLSGELQASYPTGFPGLGGFTGAWVPSPSGTELVLGAERGLAVVANDGALVRELPVAGAPYCRPQRWWSTTSMLASCGAPNRLYVVPVGGGTPIALTRRPVPPDSGDLSAWHLGSSVYVQVASACGYEYLARLVGDVPVRVHVPDVPIGNTVDVIGTSGNAIVAEASLACQGGPSLVRFTPSHDTTSVLLGRPTTSGYVGAALTYPAPLG